MSDYRKPYRRGSLVWPIVLISLGIVFLLDNMGVVDWDVWSMIIRLWPLLLVTAGLDILFGRRSGVWPVISVVFMIAIFAGAIWLVQSTSSLFEGSRITQNVAQPLEDAQDAELEINFDAGELVISRLDDSSNLLEGVLDLHENENLEQSYRLVGDKGYFVLESTGRYSGLWGFDDGIFNSREWVLELTDSIPLDIQISTGAGLSEIDLRGLTISKLDVETGVGEMVVYLPDSGHFEVNISGGVGVLRVFIPEGLAARIHMDAGVGNTSVIGDFEREGGVWESPNFETAEDWVEIYMSGGVGSIEVVQID